jgi:hypothetical protein
MLLHDNEGLSVVLLDSVDCADVGVVQGGRTALRAQSPQRHRIGGQLLRQEFRRDAAAQLQVSGLIDHPHAAGDDLKHPVMRDFFPGHPVFDNCLDELCSCGNLGSYARIGGNYHA